MKVSALRSFVWAGMVALFTFPLLCQTVGTETQQPAPCKVDSAGPVHLQPYTAEFKIIGGNGTTTVLEGKEISARDSQGRTFSQTSFSFSGEEKSAVHTSGQVLNSLDGMLISSDSQGKKVTVLKMPVGDQKRGCWESDSGNGRWDFGSTPAVTQATRKGRRGHLATHAATAGNFYRPEDIIRPVIEDLGTTTIQGLEVHGTRSTATMPAGNTKSVHTLEQWTAKDLGLTVREVTEDSPSGGKTIKELVSLKHGEPDPALFQPPQGYETVAEGMHRVSCPNAPTVLPELPPASAHLH